MDLRPKRHHYLFSRAMNSPAPVREVFKQALKRLRIGSFEFRNSVGAVDRPHYAYLIYNAAKLAKKLGHERISVLEYGVAGGAGLLSMEKHAAEVQRLIGVEVELYGFDLGTGLPAPKDYRDLPYHWRAGMFGMDEEDLRARLQHAKLVIGSVEDTSKDFFEKFSPAPIGAIAHDFDFYSSTKSALQMLPGHLGRYLPRVYCYFDDTVGSETELYNDYTGQRLAINEFNNENSDIKLAKPYYLISNPGPVWHHQIWIGHFFNHPQYNTFVSIDEQQLPISSLT